MKNSLYLLAFAALMMASGCRLSRQPEGLVQQTPLAASALPRQVSRPPGEEPSRLSEEAPPPRQPTARDYLRSLLNSLAQARQEAKREEFERLLRPEGALAMANLALSLLESNLPQATALHELRRAGQLLSEEKSEEAATALEALILRIGTQMKEPSQVGLSVDSLRSILKDILAGNHRQAARRIEGMIDELAASSSLRETREIRANLQEATSAAARKSQPIAEAALNDAFQRASHLEETWRETKEQD